MVVGVVLDGGVDGRRTRRRRRRLVGSSVVGGDVEALEGDGLERPLDVWVAVEDGVEVEFWTDGR